MLRVAKLGDQERSRSVGNGDSETEEETSSDKHLEVNRSTLENDGQDHNE